MKYQFAVLLSSFLIFTLISGCGEGGNDIEAQGVDGNDLRGYQQPNQHFVINRRANTEIDQYNRFGFGRETIDSTNSGQASGEYAVYDRSLMAEAISQLLPQIPSVDEAAVLVTDQHVLMAYDANVEDMEVENRELVATQVKKTALSFVPAYYDIYVSDNPRFMQDIERFRGLTTENPSYIGTLEDMIEEMKAYPQGEKVDLSNEPMHNNY